MFLNVSTQSLETLVFLVFMMWRVLLKLLKAESVSKGFEITIANLVLKSYCSWSGWQVSLSNGEVMQGSIQCPSKSVIFISISAPVLAISIDAEYPEALLRELSPLPSVSVEDDERCV